MKEEILKQYDEKCSLYESFGDECQRIILQLLHDAKISLHQTTARIKRKENLSRKIDIKKDKYADLSEITDISGVRIITYLESDVDKIAIIIEKEFDIDHENSIDKRKLKADQFGYRSLHYVISLSPDRLKLSENKKYNKLKTEIQVRSILQHAWAEIEHDLGYKGVISVPEVFRRDFNRIAAQLETADIEFDRLKQSLSKYEANISADIIHKPNEVKLDQASLSSFVSSNKVFVEARHIIAANVGCSFTMDRNLISELERFEFFKIHTIGELNELINKSKKQYLSFVDEFTKDLQANDLDYNIPLFYFQHFLAAKSEDEDYVKEYFNYGKITLSGSRTPKNFIDTYIKSKK